MKLRYPVFAGAFIFLFLLIFQVVGEQRSEQCPAAGLFTVGDAASLCLFVFVLLGAGLFFGYMLGHDDGREEGRMSR